MTVTQEHVTTYVQHRVTRGELTADSANNYRRLLTNVVAYAIETDGGSMTEATVVEWLATLGGTRSTIGARVRMIRLFCEWLVRQNIIAVNPVDTWSPPNPARRVPRPVERSVVGHLMSTARTHQESLIVSLMVQEGMRCGEVAILEWSGIDLVTRWARVTGKNGHERNVPLTLKSAALLAIQRDSQPSGDRVIRHHVTGRDVARGYPSKVITAMARRAKLDVSAHRLRATAATDMLNRGANPRDVQAILGHRSLATTNDYLRPLLDDLREGANNRRLV